MKVYYNTDLKSYEFVLKFKYIKISVNIDLVTLKLNNEVVLDNFKDLIYKNEIKLKLLKGEYYD